MTALPQKIERLENEEQQIQGLISDAGFYQSNKEEIKKTLDRLEEIQLELSRSYDRWEYLDNLS